MIILIYSIIHKTKNDWILFTMLIEWLIEFQAVTNLILEIIN